MKLSQAMLACVVFVPLLHASDGASLRVSAQRSNNSHYNEAMEVLSHAAASSSSSASAQSVLEASVEFEQGSKFRNALLQIRNEEAVKKLPMHFRDCLESALAEPRLIVYANAARKNAPDADEGSTLPYYTRNLATAAVEDQYEPLHNAAGLGAEIPDYLKEAIRSAVLVKTNASYEKYKNGKLQGCIQQ